MLRIQENTFMHTFFSSIIIYPHVYLLTFTLILLWFGVYFKHKKPEENFSLTFGNYSIYLLFMLSNLVAFGAYTKIQVNNQLHTSINIIFDSYFSSTPLSTAVISLTLLIASITILVCTYESEQYSWKHDLALETNILRLFIVFSLILLVLAQDLILIFFILEIYSLASYVLIGKSSRTSLFSGEAAIKYFYNSTIFSIIMIFGISLIYMDAGSSNLFSLSTYYASRLCSWNASYFFTIGIICVISSLFFKLSVAPFHFWAPDTYEGAPTTVMFFLAVVPKIAIFFILMKISALFKPLWFVFILCTILSVLIGGFMGIYQTKFKRLLTYSMVSNTGLIIGLACISMDVLSWVYVLSFLFLYSLNLIVLFALFITNKTAFSHETLKDMFSLTNLSLMNEAKYIVFVITMFNASGVPPFMMFFAKFLGLHAYTVSFTLVGCALIILLFSALPVFYYIRVIKIMSFIKKRFWIFYKNPSNTVAVIILLLTILSVVLLCLSYTVYAKLIIIFL